MKQTLLLRFNLAFLRAFAREPGSFPSLLKDLPIPGGGGGGRNTSGSGGSGIVIIRYLGSQRGTGGTVTSSGGYTIHTFTSSGTFTA